MMMKRKSCPPRLLTFGKSGMESKLYDRLAILRLKSISTNPAGKISRPSWKFKGLRASFSAPINFDLADRSQAPS
jgi:hypothetical protein